jgi:hypothetical protein
MQVIKFFTSERNKKFDNSKMRDTFEHRHFMIERKFNRVRRGSDSFCKCELIV